MNHLLKTFVIEKPYPLGYEIPPLGEYSEGECALLMPPPVEGLSEALLGQMPETFVMRSRVEKEILSLWPVLEMPDGTAVSMEDQRLYSVEAREILRAPRLQKISLIFTGIYLVPDRQGGLLPWVEGLSCLPLKKGEIFFSHSFSPMPLTVSFPEKREGKLSIFSLGGLLCPLNLLKSSSLGAFVEGSAASFPKVRLLLVEDLVRFHFTSPEDGEALHLFSAEDTLVHGGVVIKTLHSSSFSYTSTQVNIISRASEHVDIVMIKNRL